MTYEEAINQVKLGYKAGFQYLYHNTCGTILYIIGEITKNAMNAEEIIEDTYLSAIKKIDTLKNPEIFPSWIGIKASRLATKRAKKNKRTMTKAYASIMENKVNEKLSMGIITPEEAYSIKETSRLLHELTSEMSEKQRLCIFLLYGEEYSIDDLAQACECKKSTIKKIIKKSNQKIEEKI